MLIALLAADLLEENILQLISGVYLLEAGLGPILTDLLVVQ